MRGRLSALTAGLALLSACSGIPDYGPLDPGKGRLVVVPRANPRRGVSFFATPAYRYEHQPKSDATARFATVNYDTLYGIIVQLTGAGLDDLGPAPRAVTLTLAADGFIPDWILSGPRGKTDVILKNTTAAAVTVSCLGWSKDVTVPAGGVGHATFADPGTYEVNWEGKDRVSATCVVAESTYASMVLSGNPVLFNNVPPGEYKVRVTAPRLPEETRDVRVNPDKIDVLRIVVGVDSLPVAAGCPTP